MSLISLQLLFISLLSFFLPTQLGLHLVTLSSPVYGFVIDYLIPTIYLTDMLVLLIVILGFRKDWFNKKNLKLIIPFIVFIFINILLSDYKLSSAYKWLKVIEMIMLGVVLIKTKSLKIVDHFIKPLSYSMLLCLILGVIQYLNKSSIGGIFYLLGERSLMFSDPNVSPYPYSTFSHPNSFAGFMLVYGILLLIYRKNINTKYLWLQFVLILTNLVLTNSLNVYLTIVVLLFIKLVDLGFIKNTYLSLFLIDFTSRSFVHRVELIKASLKMIKDNLFFGVGLNNFIPNLPKFNNLFLNAWELQPVHNIFLLVGTELGIIGLLIFIKLIISTITISNFPLLAIVITGMSDHYWLTLQQNILLMTIIISYSIKNSTVKK